MEIAGWKGHAMLLRYLGEAKAEDQGAAFAKLDADLPGKVVGQFPRIRLIGTWPPAIAVSA